MTSPTDQERLTEDYTIDPEHTRIGFVARHALVSKVRGAFTEFAGAAHLDGENPANSSAELTIQAASTDTRNADRDGHPRGNDFLAMEDYPVVCSSATRSCSSSKSRPSSGADAPESVWKGSR